MSRPLRGAHPQFVVDLSVFCRRGLCCPLGIAGRSRLLQDCPAPEIRCPPEIRCQFIILARRDELTPDYAPCPKR